jgi:hypothetical protein
MAPAFAIFLTVLLGSPAVLAQMSEDRFVVRGFGTLALTTHDAEGIEFRRNVGQASGIESGKIGVQSDSLAGLQFNANLTAGFGATLQAVTRLDADGDWSPRVTQAFLRYSPDDSLVFRAGRFGYEIYLNAESRQVGYSYLAVRPSQDFYGLVTHDEVDGVDVSWTSRLGRGLIKARVFGGRGSDQTVFPDRTRWEGDSDAVGLTLDYSLRALTARAAMLQVSYGRDPALRELGAFLVSTGVPPSVSLGDDLYSSNQTSRAVQLGLAYDDGPVEAQLLYGHILSDSIAGPNVSAFYSQVGYRLGDFTPFVSYARSKDRHPMRSTGLPESPELLPVIEAVAAIQRNVRASQHSTSLGLRWDLSSHWAFKLQADFASIHDSALNFDTRPPGSGEAQMTVVTAAVDFVF